MASAEQLKALLRSHLEGDNDRFISVAMQVAAHEAKVGHGKLATELRDIIDKAKSRRGAGSPVPIGRPRGELANLLEASFPKARLGDMILGEALASRIDRIIREQRHASQILDHGLSPRRKLLLVGPPGTGKTLSASVLAGELGLPLLQVRLDGLITRFMGETAAKLRRIFDATDQTRGVYFFDEFDAIGSERGIANDVGEIRRVLNSFLQMIEQDDSPQHRDGSYQSSERTRPGALPPLGRHSSLRDAGRVPNRRAVENAGWSARFAGHHLERPREAGSGPELRGRGAGGKRRSQGRTRRAAAADPGGGDSGGDRRAQSGQRQAGGSRRVVRARSVLQTVADPRPSDASRAHLHART